MECGTGTRVDFLMSLTNASNAQLAHALSFDASYISRIRSGKRGLPPAKPFIEPASTFFARRVVKGYQKRTLADELGLTSWPDDVELAAALIANWLRGTVPETSNAGSFPPLSADDPSSIQRGVSVPARLFFGQAGRRDAALTFLSTLCDANYTGELLLQSDEDMAWMYDETFVQRWSALLSQLARCGCTMRVVHTMSRDADEMWEGVRRWLPLYLTGVIHPYYYPRLRDGVRTRSLFVAPGHAALVSNAVRGMGDGELSILFEEPAAVAALHMEFDAYLALCRPLVHVLDIDDEHGAAEMETWVASNAQTSFIDALGATVVLGDSKALILSADRPDRAFAVDEPRLVAALCEYLSAADPV